MIKEIKETAAYIGDNISVRPEIGMVFGSGLGSVADNIDGGRAISYSDIPNFPRATVKGHKGNLVWGDMSGRSVLAMQGRFHYYEGHTMGEVTFPVRVFRELGIETIVLTGAAGGLSDRLSVGDIVALADHINFMGDNPLIGVDDKLGPRFLDLTEAYDPSLKKLALDVMAELGQEPKEGVYVGVMGPSYETAAEARLLSKFADVVGMSIIPEVIAARHSGMKVLALALVTNVSHEAGGVSHDEVVTESGRFAGKMESLLEKFLGRI